MEKKKILMIGLGSIGQRHVRNLRTLYGDRVELIAYRSRGHKTTFTDKLQIREGVDVEQEYGITSYTDLGEALAQKPDIAFITNVTAKHMECAQKAAEAGCHLFIEKPLGASMDGVDRLEKTVKEKNLVVYLGFQNRYHPCVQQVKKLLVEGTLGTLLYAEADFSERVTTMHTYEDYRQTYMARKDLGGGPVLNLQMHDLDLLQWFFGMPQTVVSLLQKESDLEIDVEEGASAILRFPRKGGSFMVTAHTDFLRYPPTHRLRIVGSEGRVDADLLAATCRVQIGEGSPEETAYPDFVRNDMFLRELREFTDCVERGDTDPPIGLQDGIRALQIAEAIKDPAAGNNAGR